MHFLHVIHRYYPYTGGSESYIQDLSERLVRDGHRVTVLTTDAWDIDHFWGPARRIEEPEAVHNGVRILRFPVRYLPRHWLVHHYLRAGMRKLARLPGSVPVLNRLATLSPWVPGLGKYLAQTRERFDLVHTTNLVFDFAVVPPLRFARRRGLPHLCTPFVHLGEPGNPELEPYYAQPHQLAALRASTRVIVQTDLEREFLRSQGVPDGVLRTVGCWVKPCELEGGDAERFRLEHGVEGPVVLSVGTCTYEKGTVHLLQAMQRLWRAGSEATLVLVASSTQPSFEAAFAELPDEDRPRVRLLGAAPHRTKLDALAAASLLALPSRAESFGIAFLEAWMYGLPVIGARAGGIPAVVEEGRTGLLVDFGDVEALAASLERLLSDRDFARTLGENGRVRVLRDYTFEQRYRANKAVYEEALGRPV